LLSDMGKDAERDLIHKVQEELEIRGNLRTKSGAQGQGKLSKALLTPIVDLCNGK
jgi:hypothetical protein